MTSTSFRQPLTSALKIDSQERFDLPFLRRLLQAIDVRLAPLQEQQASVDEAISGLNEVALDRINTTLTPAIERVLLMSERGFLIAQSATDATLAVGNILTFTIADDTEREVFTPSPFTALTREGSSDDYAVARTVAYDKVSGDYRCEVLSFVGNAGPHSDWVIGALAGSTAAQYALLEEGQTARAAVVAARQTVLSARDLVVEKADAVAEAESRINTISGRIDLGDLDAAVEATGADATQTGLDRISTSEDASATAADRVQTGLDVTAAEAARDLAVDAVQYDYFVDDATALAALTGMVSGEHAYQRDTEHVHRYDGSAWDDQGEAPTKAKANQSDFSELRDSLFAVEQAIGCPDADMDAGTGSAGAGTYCFSTPIGEAGGDFTFTCYATGAGTIDLRFMSRSGDVFTVEASRQITVEVGVNTFNFDDLPYSSGWFAGFSVNSNRIGIEAGTDGYYSATGVIVDTGQTFTDSTASVIQFKARFDFTKQYATGPLTKQAYDDIEELQNFVGVGDGAEQIIGLPDGVTLATGSGIGGSYYIFEGEADVDRYLNELDVWATQAGVIQVQAWSVDGGGDVTLERQVGVTVEVGLNQITDVGLEVKAGERVGFFRGTGGVALNSAGSYPTSHRSILSTSGTPSPVNSSLRFEFRATLGLNSLDVRVIRLEGVDADTDAGLLSTHTYHALWMLGESHVAGRATTLSDAVIPTGKGYAYRRASGAMAHLQDPTGNDSTAISGEGRGSWGPRMGRMLLDMTHGAIGAAVVNSGLGSSYIGSHWASGGAGWTQAVTDWATAKTQMDTLNRSLAGASVMIAIGSNDAAAGTSKATFKADFLDLISRVRVELGYDVPILILPTGPFANGDHATEVAYIQAAQHEIAKETAGCYIVTTATEYASDNGWFMDNVHFTQTGNEAIGAAAGALSFAVGSGNSAR